MASAAGVPIKLLHEGQGHVVALELKTGEVYRGKLEDSQDSMNCHLSSVTARGRDGQERRMQSVFIRGSQIRFVVLPDFLTSAPMFKAVEKLKESRAVPFFGPEAVAHKTKVGRNKVGSRDIYQKPQ